MKKNNNAANVERHRQSQRVRAAGFERLKQDVAQVEAASTSGDAEAIAEAMTRCRATIEEVEDVIRTIRHNLDGDRELKMEPA